MIASSWPRMWSRLVPRSVVYPIEATLAIKRPPVFKFQAFLN